MLLYQRRKRPVMHVTTIVGNGEEPTNGLVLAMHGGNLPELWRVDEHRQGGGAALLVNERVPRLRKAPGLVHPDSSNCSPADSETNGIDA